MHGQVANLDLKQWMGFAENLGKWQTGGLKPAGLHLLRKSFCQSSWWELRTKVSFLYLAEKEHSYVSIYIICNASEIQILHVKHLK